MGSFLSIARNETSLVPHDTGARYPSHKNQFFTGTGDHRIYIYISLPNINSQWEGVIHEQQLEQEQYDLHSNHLSGFNFAPSDCILRRGSRQLTFVHILRLLICLDKRIQYQNAFAQTSLHYFPNYFSFNCLLQFQAIAERRKSVSLTKVAK